MYQEKTYSVAGQSSEVLARNLFYAIAVVTGLYLALFQLPKVKVSYVEPSDSSYYVPEGYQVVPGLSPDTMPRVSDAELPIQEVEPVPEPAPVEAPVAMAEASLGVNEAAPVWSKSIDAITVYRYIDRFGPVAVAEMRKYGIPASICMAQAIVESRAGTSKLCVNANNHFGIKCKSKRCGKGHCLNFGDDHHKDFFRKYKTAWTSWRDHSELLNNRYGSLKQCGNDYRAWARGLQRLGYATDRQYADKLIGVIVKYNLQKFDKQ